MVLLSNWSVDKGSDREVSDSVIRRTVTSSDSICRIGLWHEGHLTTGNRRKVYGVRSLKASALGRRGLFQGNFIQTDETCSTVE